jgi:hypothetical protein
MTPLETASGMDDFAGNPLVIVACQKSDQTGCIFWQTDQAHRESRQQCIFLLFGVIGNQQPQIANGIIFPLLRQHNSLRPAFSATEASPAGHNIRIEDRNAIVTELRLLR